MRKRLHQRGPGNAKKRGAALVVELNGVRDDLELATIERIIVTRGRFGLDGGGSAAG